ncbi:hypothetical protein WMY93_006479 [Mugilogobius chulae]|uniref:[histone H3]-dimethyl-L-lysine(36) demethylase n=1 Tax=Mugilogobius chulae TaxID=88201 RepID=A0AAW0PVM6_9GOBI
MDDKPRYSKRLRTGTRRRYHDDGISDEEIDGRRMFDLEEKVHSQRFNSDRVVRMQGKDFTYEYVQRGGLRDPIIFEKPDGLGIKMPEPDFSVSDVKLFVGSRRMIDVMDVSTQKGTEMSMAQWTRYYETPPPQREKLYNVISLEFSHTKLENLVQRPKTVDQIDWVDNMWPRHLKEKQRDATNSINDMQYPKVQKYCLMSVEGCYTDFHIDFGGTSVWYHILRGSKVFWLIPPTPQNLELYENWVLSGKQGDVFLGDRATDCQRIELKKGFTFFIPSGAGEVSFPVYYEMCWYVLERYVFCLTKTSYLTPEFQKHSLGIGLKKPADAVDNPKASDSSEEERRSDKVKVYLTPFELEGLWNLLGKLESLPTNKKCVPSGIHNAPALMTHLKALLKEHANDTPKLSYNGKPIIKWPKRPSWYQPPPPPPPPPRPKPATTPVTPRPQKPSSSMSVLRRRRVRCKRCEACVRTECGECNFCRDMKKFGGPGKLKQTCVLRQCLSPGLPLSAVCDVCKDPNQEEDGLPLMECSNCGQIVHPSCLSVSGEGVINKDLPSCWECPKCVQGLTDQESKGGDGLPAKRKSSSLLDARMAKIYRQHRHSRDDDSGSEDDDEEGSRGKKLSLHRSSGSTRRGLTSTRRGLLRKGHRGNRGAVPGRRGALREGGKRGRGVRLRGGSRVQRRGDDSEESEDDDDDEDDEDEDDEEDEEEEDSEDGEKPRSRQKRRRRRTDDDEDEDSEGADLDAEDEDLDSMEEDEEEGQWDSDPEPPVLLMSDFSDELLSGACLSVTVQTPHRGKKPSGSIVPKLEARSSGQSQKKTPKPVKKSDTDTPKGPGRPRVGGKRDTKDHSSSDEEAVAAAAAAALSMSPPSLLSLPSFKDVGNEKGGEKELWVSVFKYLSRSELLSCMLVCKAWYKWSCDKRLWTHMDISRCSALSNQALAGIVKRQPTALDLSWTPVAKRQLNCLLTRLPGLRELSVAGLPWSCLSALVCPTLPCLRLLDLRWCEGIKDIQLKEIILPPGLESSRSRLRNLLELRLSGLEISDSTLRLIQRHMSQLQRLDLAHCKDVTDSTIAMLSSSGTHTRHNLTELTLSGCDKLTDGALLYLKRFSSLSLLDLRGCSHVSRRGCDSFISDLSHRLCSV